jgi:uncharacterized membrane-anchored protein YhcB (DUF1043 family)
VDEINRAIETVDTAVDVAATAGQMANESAELVGNMAESIQEVETGMAESTESIWLEQANDVLDIAREAADTANLATAVANEASEYSVEVSGKSQEAMKTMEEQSRDSLDNIQTQSRTAITEVEAASASSRDAARNANEARSLVDSLIEQAREAIQLATGAAKGAHDATSRFSVLNIAVSAVIGVVFVWAFMKIGGEMESFGQTSVSTAKEVTVLASQIEEMQSTMSEAPEPPDMSEVMVGVSEMLSDMQTSLMGQVASQVSEAAVSPELQQKLEAIAARPIPDPESAKVVTAPISAEMIKKNQKVMQDMHDELTALKKTLNGLKKSAKKADTLSEKLDNISESVGDLAEDYQAVKRAPVKPRNRAPVQQRPSVAVVRPEPADNYYDDEEFAQTQTGEWPIDLQSPSVLDSLIPESAEYYTFP